MLFTILFSAAVLAADISGGTDALPPDTLSVATVTADKGLVVSRADTLIHDGTFTLTQMLQQCPGLHVGDNGGLAGLKTVSLRGLGSAHTFVYIDGVRVGNVQSGQTDLGMIGSSDIGKAVVDYAQNSISFITVRPEFGDKPVDASVRMSAGSFGTYLPSARLAFRLGDALSLMTSAEAVMSRGDFPYGDGSRRQNNDLRRFRAGIDLFGSMTSGDYHVKASFNGSERGTPGTVDWPSDDSQRDRNIYVQGSMSKSFSSFYTLRLSAKASYDDIFYTSSWGDSRYGQTELQVNSSHSFQIRKWWKLSLAAGIQWDRLRSTDYCASRLTAFSAMASSFRAGRMTASLALEYSGSFDAQELDRHAFSPSFDIRFNVFEGFDLVAFGRRAYRVPVFNELYYEGYGNPELSPEDAWLADIGVDFRRKLGDRWYLKAKADGFFNFLKDKIISAPTQSDPNVWLPYNIGKVHSAGVDAAFGFGHSGEWEYSADVRYSCQHAVDKTPGSGSYGLQIPYVARHTLVITASLAWEGWKLRPLWQIRGGRTDGYGAMPGWDTLDLTLSKNFPVMKTGQIDIFISASDVLDCRYEISKGYPMPGRSLLCGIDLKF